MIMMMMMEVLVSDHRVDHADSSNDRSIMTGALHGSEISISWMSFDYI
jgi:hypothetical protein